MKKRSKWKKINTLNFATWNVQGISYKEDQLDDILAKKKYKNCSHIGKQKKVKRKFRKTLKRWKDSVLQHP
jgi:hypothetical protein